MLIYSLSDGTLIRVLKTEREIASIGPPNTYTYELELDPETNPIILNHIDAAWNETTLIDGVLAYQGNPVTVHPPGQAWNERLRQEQSDSDAANIPGWATWTAQEAQDWIDANVTNLASARTALKAMARMLLALRNKTWPNLEGS